MSKVAELKNTIDGKPVMCIPVEDNGKGMRTYVIEMDKNDLVETGTKLIDGKPVAYYKFRFLEK